MMDDIDRLIESSLQGEKPATARLISLVERQDADSGRIMEAMSPFGGKAYRIGVTGPPGAGKSTAVDRLVSLFCQSGYSVGVVAVDPTSPFSGGALLGDRIRMTSDNRNRDVFFRSMSAGRMTGGLALTTGETVKILDASGRQVIIIETVGVGQSELDIAQATDTVLVVLVPESGDTIQMMKAGLMEIADVFAINKSDRSGAEQLAGSIREMLERSSDRREWLPSIFQTAASLNRGMAELYQGLWAHHDYLQQHKRQEARRKSQLKTELQRRMMQALSSVLWNDFSAEHDLELLVQDLWETKTDVRAAAEKAVKTWLNNKLKK